jgi:hypothetical protein
MPQTEKLDTTSRRSLLATLAAAVPAAVAGAPMAAAALADQPAQAKPEINLMDGANWLANAMLTVNIAAIGQDDKHILYTVRVPREALLGSDPYPYGLTDERFCADVAAFMAARIRELTPQPAPLA